MLRLADEASRLTLNEVADQLFTEFESKVLPKRERQGARQDGGQGRAQPEGVERLSFHDLRHTAITHLIRSGADAAQVSRFAGHSKVSTTLDLYVGEFEKRRANDSGTRLAAIYAGGLGGAGPRP